MYVSDELERIWKDVSDALEGIWKEAFVACFKVLSLHLRKTRLALPALGRVIEPETPIIRIKSIDH
jgi:hypothetical protein